MQVLKFQRGRTSVVVLGLTALLILGGCDSGGEGDQAQPGQPAAGAPGGAAGSGAQPGAAEVKTPEGTAVPAAASGPVFQVDKETAATITGKAAFSGNPPTKPPPIQFSADPHCAALHKEPAYPEDVVVNENKTLKNVFVYVSKGLEGKTFAAPTEPVVFDQRGCQYHPHVFGIMAKQPLQILNSDATNHNVHALPTKQQGFNDGMPQKDMKITRKFNKPEVMVTIKCEVHNWMKAFCGVLDHPYYSVTDEKGEFKIENLPPGKYTLTAWHEKLGQQTKDVEVGPKDAKSVDFEFK